MTSEAGLGLGIEAADRARARAAAAFLLALIAVLGAIFGLGILGLPALVLATTALVEARHARTPEMRTRSGRGLARAAAALGVLGVSLSAFWTLAFASLLAWPRLAPSVAVQLDAVGNEPTVSWPDAPRRAHDGARMVRVVVLHRADGPLRSQLAAQAAAAQASGEIVMVQTTMDDCDACVEIVRAMHDPAVGAALSKVRIVYVDTGEFHPELGRLRMDEATAPWFYLIDSRGEPRDAITADEWDENDAANIAPVLEAFVLGRLQARRHAWHDGVTL